MLSGFAGVYFEKILKVGVLFLLLLLLLQPKLKLQGSDVSVWMRNVQLAILSVPMGLVTAYVSDGHKIGQLE